MIRLAYHPMPKCGLHAQISSVAGSLAGGEMVDAACGEINLKGSDGS